MSFIDVWKQNQVEKNSYNLSNKSKKVSYLINTLQGMFKKYQD